MFSLWFHEKNTFQLTDFLTKSLKEMLLKVQALGGKVKFLGANAKALSEHRGAEDIYKEFLKLEYR